LSANTRNDRHPEARADTVIGAGLRLKGNISCTGVLRILGEIHGEVSCDADASGTIVVGGSGSVSGAIRAPHIVVGGRVLGPLDSSRSIEIQPEASVAGDIRYRAMHIHPGGVIEGSLRPKGMSESDENAQQTGRLPPMPAAGREGDIPSDAAAVGGSLRKPTRPVARIVGALALLGVIVTIALLNRSPEPAAPPAAEDTGNTSPVAAPSATAGVAVRQDSPGTAAGTSPLEPSTADADATKPAPEPPPQASAAGSEKVVSVHGVNPGKPGGVFSVVGKEPSVLIRKKHDEASEGTRIEIPQGAAASIPFARNEIFRVAQGRDLEIFYQGRKVGRKTIESGVWMSFVPQLSSASGK
jgi:cytoskeletal protein CcmA (bactofilin family)